MVPLSYGTVWAMHLCVCIIHGRFWGGCVIGCSCAPVCVSETETTLRLSYPSWVMAGAWSGWWWAQLPLLLRIPSSAVCSLCLSSLCTSFSGFLALDGRWPVPSLVLWLCKVVPTKN